jgi:Fe-S-cluster containining protein
LTRVLSIHAEYRCRSTGVCCSSGWDVPVEPPVEDRLRAALKDGSLRPPDGTSVPFRAVAGLPHGARVVFGTDSRGRCVFLEAGERSLCAVHRQLGFVQLASACRDFPRVVTLSPLGVSITLSHYCPTAAELLFCDDRSLALENEPPAFPSSWPYEGLDARSSVPPLLRPGVLMGWEAWARWEAHAVATLDRGELTPEGALALLAAQAEAARTWRPANGDFDAYLERCLATPSPIPAASAPSLDECRRGWQLVAECVPRGHPVPEPPFGEAGELRGREDAVFTGPVADDWGDLAAPVRRWLAAKAFASWLALQGEGLRTTVLGVRLALAVLRAEAARRAAEGEGRGEATDLLKAIRRADLLLVHLADPETLGRRLSRVEGLPGSPARAW